MFTTIAEMLRYGFMVRALLVGCAVAVCAAILGQFLVLRKFSMIGDGLAHVSFAAVGLSLVLGTAPMLTAVPIVLIASILILRLKSVRGDAAIGLLSSLSVAFGILVASISKGFNVDLLSYLFGSILAVTQTDLYIALALTAVILAIVLLVYERLFAFTYDETFARSLGLSAGTVDLVLATLTSLTIVIGIRIVGTMLISSMVVFPTVTAIQWRCGFRRTMFLSVFFSLTAVLIGLWVSFAWNLPSGACIVLVNGVYFTLSFVLNRLILRR
ncbi:MAG: metal ABC transporter permease [Bacillota bacterium]|nr:metal ABC transporter permease [Bacillota bacterium]